MLFYQVAVCFLVSAEGNEDFFSEIHTDSLSHFGWLSQGFGSLEKNPEPQIVTQYVHNHEKIDDAGDDKDIVKRHYPSSPPKTNAGQNKVYYFNPSNYYYPKKVSQYKTEDKLTVKLKEEEYGEFNCCLSLILLTCNFSVRQGSWEHSVA